MAAHTKDGSVQNQHQERDSLVKGLCQKAIVLGFLILCLRLREFCFCMVIVLLHYDDDDDLFLYSAILNYTLSALQC